MNIRIHEIVEAFDSTPYERPIWQYTQAQALEMFAAYEEVLDQVRNEARDGQEFPSPLLSTVDGLDKNAIRRTIHAHKEVMKTVKPETVSYLRLSAEVAILESSLEAVLNEEKDAYDLRTKLLEAEDKALAIFREKHSASLYLGGWTYYDKVNLLDEKEYKKVVIEAQRMGKPVLDEIYAAVNTPPEVLPDEDHTPPEMKSLALTIGGVVFSFVPNRSYGYYQLIISDADGQPHPQVIQVTLDSFRIAELHDALGGIL